ncbi:arylsulfatase B-like isoform X2 [Uloborus diversus]|uniref:arylsulfatase B-like isoform X2 n=1 Tax=Uloborus diversus TaxID=327109 RepID=UPI0024097531|nr:arylsulfatase B-like isoform X2 [Uloborus diversus]
MVEKGEGNNESTCNFVWCRIAAMVFSIVLVATVFTLVAYLNKAAPSPKIDPPHIIFILADDLGWNDVSFHGSPQIPTPNIDALAASGIVLNNYYTHPQCTPSRGALMSGKYATRLGLHHGDLRPAEASGLPLDVTILPEHLQKLGYKTHMVGKWHLGYYKRSFLPTRRGFDSFFGFLNDNIDYYDYTSYYVDQTSAKKILENVTIEGEIAPDAEINTKLMGIPGNKAMFGIDLWENEEVVRDFRGEYATNVFTDRALSVLDEHNASKPLFLFMSHAACHTGNPFYPLQTPAELFERNNHISDEKRRLFAGMVTALDDSVGKIFQALKEKDMLKKSVIVISSDNGGVANSGTASNWPLRGMKYFMWEGGVRTVGLVWSPLLGLTKPRVSMQMMHITDWLPTFYQAAGGDLKDLGEIDGLNMWPVMMSEKMDSPREEVLLNIDAIEQTAGFRKGDMKLLVSLSPVNDSDWYGASGIEESNVTGSMDDWVWKNGSIVKDILMETNQWLLTENDTWRNDAMIVCGENFLPVSGKCDFSEGPCLYNVTDDPCEYRNIAKLNPEIVNSILERLRDLNETTLPAQTKDLDPLGDPICHNFAHVPWMDEEEEATCVISL